jgi:hypothetical protein
MDDGEKSEGNVKKVERCCNKGSGAVDGETVRPTIAFAGTRERIGPSAIVPTA